MSETPQRHSHSGPGDGGKIDFASEAGGLSEVASGTVDVADSSGSTANSTDNIGITDQSRQLVVIATVDALDSNAVFGKNILVASASPPQVSYRIQFKQGVGWQVRGETGDHSAVTISYTVYER